MLTDENRFSFRRRAPVFIVARYSSSLPTSASLASWRSPLFYFHASGWSSLTKSAAAALDSTCLTSLQPGMVAVTASFLRHPDRAHWAMGTLGGDSSLGVALASRKRLSVLFWPWP